MNEGDAETQEMSGPNVANKLKREVALYHKKQCREVSAPAPASIVVCYAHVSSRGGVMAPRAIKIEKREQHEILNHGLNWR